MLSILALFSMVMPSYATTTAPVEVNQSFMNQTVSATTSTTDEIVKTDMRTDGNGMNRVVGEEKALVATRKATITAYSSTPDQTDDSPFIMANGKRVHDGAIAANFLPFGARVRIPDLFGDKVFTVHDRMHKRFNNRVDIWMPTRHDAIQFGLRQATIEIIL